MNKRLALLSILLAMLAGCGSSGGSSSAGTQVLLSATPSAINSLPKVAGTKTFTNNIGDSITLNTAYLVIASVTLETSCGVTFSTMLDRVFESIIPVANAHTTSTPTSTGEPYVINILAADDLPVSVGSISPPAADYCGATIDLLPADADANNLPTDAPPNNMVGSSVYIVADYSLSGGGSGSFTINTSIAPLPRDLMFSALMMLSASNLNDSATLAINYDTWFDAVSLAALEAGPLDTGNPVFVQLLNKISASIHQQ
jgi:hypothetical protein